MTIRIALRLVACAENSVRHIAFEIHCAQQSSRHKEPDSHLKKNKLDLQFKQPDKQKSRQKDKQENRWTERQARTKVDVVEHKIVYR